MGPIRQRKALSCVDCRRRKVKCDRTYPICVRCQKSGNADNCNYVSVVGATSTAIPTPSDDDADQQHNEQPENPPEELDNLIAPWQRQDGYARTAPVPAHPPPPPSVSQQIKSVPTEKELLARVIELESYVRAAGGKPVSAEMRFGIGNPLGPGYQADRNPMSDYDKVMVRGQSFSTQYFGPSVSISLLLQFDDLSKFVKDILSQAPDLREAKQQMVSVRGASRKMPKAQVPHDLRNLIRMVPSKDKTDRCVEHYLETIETTYRIVHVPSFRTAYESFWENPRQSRPEFVVQLLLTVACVYCIVPGGPQGYVGRSSARREMCTRWITACESWVNEQSKKHMTMSHLQIHVLIHIARGNNCIKVKREWISSGNLLRIAMGAGMHREPSFLSRKISVFECEMRRRLWFTIIELDLMSTLCRGMTPSIDAFGWDCLTPRNIHDEDFDDKTETMPESRPRTEFTRTAFLHTMNEFLSLRLEILGRLNSIRLGVDLETVMQYDNKLRKVIDGLPTTWDKTALAVVAHPILRLVVYEYILILHVPFACQTSNQSRWLYSIASRRDAAIKTLRIYSQLSPLHRLHIGDMREDTDRASLSICHDLVTNDDRDQDPIANVARAFDLILCVIELLAERVRTLGQGFHAFWITTTAHALTRWKVSGEESPDRFAREAADRVVSLFKTSLLSNQVEMPALDGSTNTTTAATTAANTNTNNNTATATATSTSANTPVLGNMLSPTDTNNTLASGIRNNSGNSVDGTFTGFEGMGDDQVFDPLWDFMNFDFGSVWNLDGYQGGTY